MKLDKFFETVQGFCLERRKKHKLIDILVISVCAVVCGANDFEEIAMYGTQKIDFLRTFLALPNGIPSHDTFIVCLNLWIRRSFQPVFIVGQEKYYQSLSNHTIRLA